ncbi:OsmC family protein [Aequorivita sp. KMM 9714]|uniref:OsmC family protein n=1 Tax=Aequorivita sp. KMM 9714 TaxID=2707173 RepID=UPI0013ED8B89|nr:OsmC family protein [Aequorivita sp. KMM 9714]NGX84728.1 OsmC family protein [Aequorivita sp. KMM 9714]
MKNVKAIIREQKYKTEVQAKNHMLIADEPVELGGENLGFTPSELLESSLATCTAMTIRMFADKKGWDLKEAKVSVSLRRNLNTQAITFRKEIELVGDLDAEQRTQLHDIGTKCPIEKIIKGEVLVKSKLV